MSVRLFSRSLAVNGSLVRLVLRRSPIRRPALSAPTITNQKSPQIQKEHHPGQNAIRDLALRGVVRKLHSQPTVNDSQHDETAAKPDVSLSPEVPATLPHVDIVVNQAQKRLEEEKADDDDTDDWVRFAELVDGTHKHQSPFFQFPFFLFFLLSSPQKKH